jgi:hypothetical protein
MYGRDKKCKYSFISKSEGKIAFGRPWCRYEDNIKISSRNTI